MVTWLSALGKTRRNLAGALAKVFSGGGQDLDEDSIEDLEEHLLGADVPVALVNELVVMLEKNYRGLNVSRREKLSEILVRHLGDSGPYHLTEGRELPESILVVGINGSGKTTTCAKLAYRAGMDGHKAMLAATDTFRAAGADQLRLWADRVGCEVVAGKMGSDAAAVAYDAISAARARSADLLIVDTAGRMHTKKPLMAELDKIRRALAKQDPEAPRETWIVLDASIGHNAVLQARYFNEVVPLTGAVVTKLDGSSKAGFLFSITRELGIPVRFAGLGESMEDLVPFNPESFVDALMGGGALEEAGTP